MARRDRQAGALAQDGPAGPWAIPLLESRTSPGGAAALAQHDAVLGTFPLGRLLPALTADACALLDAFVYRFGVQETSLPFGGLNGIGEVAEPMMALMPRATTRTSSTWRSRTTCGPGVTLSTSSRQGWASCSTLWSACGRGGNGASLGSL